MFWWNLLLLLQTRAERSAVVAAWVVVRRRVSGRGAFCILWWLIWLPMKARVKSVGLGLITIDSGVTFGFISLNIDVYPVARNTVLSTPLIISQ